jgi:multidrug efflux pump subunit AcrA (membrane-fusion protein)
MQIFPSPRAFHNPRQFFFPDDPPAGDPQAPKGEEAELGDKGKEALERERSARKQAQKDLETLQASLADLQKFKDDTEAAASAAAAQRAKDQGQFEQIAKDAEAARDAAKADLAIAQDTIKQLTEAISTGLPESFEAIPEVVRNTYTGGDDNVLAKFQFVHHPATAALVKAVDPKAAANLGNGNPVDPADPTKPKVKPEDATKAQAPLYSGAF